MKRIILLSMLGVGLYSCSSNRSVLSNDYIQGSSFSGTIAAENGDHVSQVVILDSNNRFRLTETFVGKDQPCKEKSGSWTLQQGKVVLYADNEAIAQYAIAGDKLVSVDDASTVRKSNKKAVANQPSLARKKYIKSKKINPDYLDGIDIVAFGAEPSWSLDIDHSKAIQFSIPGLDAPVAFSPVSPVLSGDSIIYNIVSKEETMQIVLVPGICSDGLSDNVYDYKVTLQYKGKTYKGCGAVMNADGTLTGAWLLDNVPGETAKWKTQPYMIVDLASEKFYGNTGCNNISGSARMRGTKICFSDIKFESQKDCEGYNENRIIEALIKCNGFTISEGRLEMKQDGRTVLNFQRQLEDYL